jgi:hypothetical protein
LAIAAAIRASVSWCPLTTGRSVTGTPEAPGKPESSTKAHKREGGVARLGNERPQTGSGGGYGTQREDEGTPVE